MLDPRQQTGGLVGEDEAVSAIGNRIDLEAARLDRPPGCGQNQRVADAHLQIGIELALHLDRTACAKREIRAQQRGEADLAAIGRDLADRHLLCQAALGDPHKITCAQPFEGLHTRRDLTRASHVGEHHLFFDTGGDSLRAARRLNVQTKAGTNNVDVAFLSHMLDFGQFEYADVAERLDRS